MRLKDLADHKKLPEKILRDYGLTEDAGGVLIPYYDDTGFLLANKRRTALAARDGSFWEKGKALVPYGLNMVAMMHRAWVILVEGESDAWTCWYHGIPALGLPGANTTRCLEKAHLADIEEVYVHQENDKAGAVFAAEAVRRLRQLAYAGAVRVFHVPPPHKDLNDWYCHELAAFGDELRRRLSEAPEPSPRLERLGFTSGSSVAREASVSWLWADRVPRAALTVLDGDPGVGKSSLTLDLAARFTSGRPMPFETKPAPGSPGHVLILSAEDPVASVVVPRLELAGADISKTVFLNTDSPGDGDIEFPADWERVEALMAECPLGLVIIDPLMAFLQGSVDSNKDHDVRTVLKRMARTAEQTKAAVVVIRHLNKSNATKALYRGGGSIGISGAARCTLMAAHYPGRPGQGVLAGIKNNYGELPFSLSYATGSAETLIDWQEEVGYTADDLVTILQAKTARRIDEAATFLREQLADGEWHPVPALADAALQRGLHKKLLYRAREELPIVSRKEGFPATSLWKLDEPPQLGQ